MIRLCSMAWAFVFLLAGCAGVVKIEGEPLINNRMTVKVSQAWNRISVPGSAQPFEVWTREGVTLDHLHLWAAIQPGQGLTAQPGAGPAASQKASRVPTFAKGMPPDQLVNLFEEMYSAGGSIVTMDKVAPAQFAGESGVRFEFGVLRKGDGVQMRGVGWVAVRNGELYAITFAAPALSFFPRLLPLVESVAASARIKG